MASKSDLAGWVRQQGTPVNLGIVASYVAVALAFWFMGGKGLSSVGLTVEALSRPWTFVTYPWANYPFSDPFNLIFFVIAMLWQHIAGGSAEREMGSRRFGVFWAATVVLIGLIIWIGMQVANARGFLLFGMQLPLAAITMLWCVRNLTSRIMLYGILPLSGKILAIGLVVVTVLVYGNGNPLMGIFAALPLLGAFLFATDRIPGVGYRGVPKAVQATRAQTRYNDEYYEQVRIREQEREERERLRKMFEGSLDDDKER